MIEFHPAVAKPVAFVNSSVRVVPTVEPLCPVIENAVVGCCELFPVGRQISIWSA